MLDQTGGQESSAAGDCPLDTFSSPAPEVSALPLPQDWNNGTKLSVKPDTFILQPFTVSLSRGKAHLKTQSKAPHCRQLRAAPSLPIWVWQPRAFCTIPAEESIILLPRAMNIFLFPFPTCLLLGELSTWIWWPFPRMATGIPEPPRAALAVTEVLDTVATIQGWEHPHLLSQALGSSSCSAAAPQEGAVPRNFSAISMNFKSVESFQPGAAAVCVGMQEGRVRNSKAFHGD